MDKKPLSERMLLQIPDVRAAPVSVVSMWAQEVAALEVRVTRLIEKCDYLEKENEAVFRKIDEIDSANK